MSIHNPSREQLELEKQLLNRCLARDTLKRYPGKATRQQFYDRWSSRHTYESTINLVTAVNLEYQNFKGWCALHGIPASHSALWDYFRDTSPVSAPLSLQARNDVETGVLYSLPAPAPVAPWWSETPWLAPKSVGVLHA